MIEAELHDGTVLEFPDGTADDVIQRTVKSQLASRPKADDSRMQISPETQRVRDIDATKMKQRELAEINQGLGMPRTPDDERRMRIAKDAVEKELAVMGAPLTEAKQPVAPTPAPKPSDAGLPSFKDVRSSAETVPQLTPAEEARGSRAAFPANVQRKNVRAALPTQPVVAPAPAVAAPTAQELETASRPARMVATKGGKPLIVPESELRSRDVWDPETQGERRAPWTGEGGVMESLPGQFVAGSNQVGAQLRRMSAQGGVNERTTLVNQPPIAETRGGAASGMVAPGSLERQGRMLARDKSDLQRAELDAARAKGDMEAITPANMNFPQQAVSSLAQSAAPTLAGIGLGIVTRSPQLAMAIAGIGGGSLQAGSTYGEARDKGASHRTASLAASVGFITEALGEALPIGIAMKPGSRIAARLFDTVLAEAGQEAATQMMQDLSAYALYDPEMTLKKSWDNMKLAAFAGGMGGVAYGGIGHAAAWQPPKGSDADLAAVMDDKRPLKDIRAEQDKINAAVAFDRAAAQHAAMVAQGAAPVTAAAQPVASVPLPPIVMPEQPQAAQPQQISEAPKGEATPAAPIIADHIDHVDVAAERVDTGATPAQKEAGNYAKGHFRFGEGNALSGLGDIAIETPRGETRVAADGSWETPPLPAHYGEIKMAKGADGDKLDLFVGQNVDSTKVFLIDQIDPKTGKFDEHKALVGFNSEQEAVKAYMDSYSDDARPRIGNVSTLGARQFVNWVRNGNTKKAFNYQQPVQEKQNVPESKAAAPANEERPAASAQEHVPAGPQASTAPSEAAPSQPAGVIQREQAPVQEADASANERGIAPAPREPAPAAQQERPAAAPPAASVPAGNGLTYRVGRHSKTGALLHVVNISDRVSRDEYVSLKAKAKAAGGYYSKFVKGFIFPTEEQARSFAGEKSAPKQLETRTSTEPKPNIEQQAANITDSEFDSMFDEVSGEVAQASVPKRAEPQKVSWTEWSDIGNGYQARSSTSHPTQEIKTPNGNIITRGLDTNGRSYMEFESDTNPFTKGGMSWVDAAQKDLQSLSLPKLAGGTTTKAPAAPKPPSITGAATHAKAAVKAGLQGLDELFGKGGTLGSGPVVTPEGWAKAKPHFDAAFAEAVAAGKELRDFVRDILTRYNNSAAIKPYMKRWLDEYRAGRNTPEHVGKSDAPGAPALEGVPADEVRGTEKVGETGRSPESGGEPDISGDEHLDRQRDTAARGVDADAGTVPAAAGREQGQGREGNRESGLRRDNAVEGGQAENSERGGRSDATVTPGAPFPRPENFVITDEIELGKGGVATKYRDNVAAIKLLKQIESEGRLATPDEQKILARYVGWGGIKNAFPNPNVTPPEGWAKRAVEMKELLTPDEHEAAARSIQDAHYTSRTIVDGIWQAAQRLGFTAGRVLEPAMGTGNFFGLMPEALRATAALTGIEYDSITARIAKQLYPQADVRGPIGFHESRIAKETFNLTVGNPPFGDQSLYDSESPQFKGWSIHNFFFGKAIDTLAPGGLHIQVVSRYFMDAVESKSRDYISHRAKLIGAIRLPWNAFFENANTEVVTDIVILQKLPGSEWGTADNSWTQTTNIPDPLGHDDITVSKYFAQNPGMILGSLERSGTMRTEFDVTVQPNKDVPLSDAIHAAVFSLPSNIYWAGKTAGQVKVADKASVQAPDTTANYNVGSFFEDGDRMFQRIWTPDDSVQAKPITAATPFTENSSWGEIRLSRLRGQIQIRDAARRLLAAEKADQNTQTLDRLRKHLNVVYDAFVKEHGYLHEKSNKRVFRDDAADAPLLIALETDFDPGVSKTRAKQLGIPSRKASVVKMPIFSRRVVQPYAAPTSAANVGDAINISLSEKGTLNVEYMASLLGQTEQEVIAKITDGDKPTAYLDPETQNYELASTYLTGNVKAKHKKAVAAGLDKNADALQAAFPPDLIASDINATAGASWVSNEDYDNFVYHLLGPTAKSRISFVPETGGFAASIEGGDLALSTVRWGTPDRPATDIFARILNNKDLTVYGKHSEGNRFVRLDATQAVNDKAEEIRNEFQDWLFSEQERRERLVAHYNEHMNTSIEPKFDGSYLQFPGKVPNEIIKFRRSQINAIARMISTGKVLLDHVVGAGKTFTIIAGLMEMKRIGLVNKPMVVVPNHLVTQWATDWYRLYPGAKILAMSKDDFAKTNRARMLARVATGDWDAVIFAHSSFGFIQNDKEVLSAALRKEISEVQSAIDATRAAEGAKSRTASEFQKKKEKLQQTLKKLTDTPRDPVLTFQETGVDQVAVDELHEFKNLYFNTQRRGVGGFGNPQGSKKAFDMFVKTQWLLNKNNGRGLIGATGTPVSNSLTELYTLQKYFQMDVLEQLGLTSLDAWLNNFGVITSEFESNVTGTKYKRKERLRKITNAPEVMQLYKQFTDSVTQDQLKQNYREDNDGAEFPLPKVRSSPKSRENVVVARTPEQAAFSGDLQHRMDHLIKGGKDNALLILTDGRKAALDMRLVDPNASDNPDSKIHEAAKRITEIYEKTALQRGTQLVFLDLSTPNKHGQADARRYLKEARALLGNDNIAAFGSNRDQWHALRQMLEDRAATVNETAESEDAGGDSEIEKIQKFLENDSEIEAAVTAADTGFSVYDDLRKKLIERGVAANDIAFIHDYSGDSKKQDLFDQVNAGQMRILFGSTVKMGAGTNVQRKLVALHHMDVPWRPSDVEQREGRIIRQGNEFRLADPNFTVDIIAYATAGTSETFLWQIQEQKLVAIDSLRNFKGQRDIEDVSNDSMSAAEMKALASGNPLILEDVKLTENIRKLEGQKRRHDSNVRELQGQITRYENRIQNLPAIIDRNQPVYDAIKSYLADPYEGDPPRADVDGTRMDRTEALAHVNAVMKQADETVVVQNAGIETEKQAIQEKSKESKPGTSEHAELSKQYEELNKKLAKPQWSVSIDGTPYTSKASVIEAIQSILGDAYPVKITVEGEPLTRRSDIAERFEPIVEKLDEDAKGRTVAGQIAGQDIEFEWDETEKTRGMTVNIGSESTFIRDESVERDQGKKVTGARALSVVGGLLKENIAAHETNVANLKAARAGIGQLKEQGVGEWGKQLELDTDKARIKEVRKMLSENLTAPAETQEETQGEGPEVLKSTGMPQQMAGHVGRPTAGIPGNAAPGPDPQRIRDIIKIVRDELGIPVRQGNFAQRALGIYKRKRGVIRQRALDDIRVFAHEAGHAISEKYEKVLLPIQKQHRLELTRMAYPGAAKNQLREEGFAEFIRLYLTNRLAALRAAPSFEKDFRTAMDAAAPELMKRMDQMTDAYMLWRTASSTQVIGAGIVKARKKPTFISKSIERGLPKTISAVAEDAYRGVVDDKAPIRIAVAMLKDVKNQNAGKRIPLKMVEDAYKLDALANYSFGTGHEEILHGVIPFEQVDPITRGLPEAISVAIGKTAHDWNDAAIKLFDGYLLSRRAVHEWGRYERGELKNEPTAQTKGDHEQNIIDMEAAHPTFKDGADIVYEWVQALWSKKLDAGLITQDQYDAGVKNHPDYVPMMRDMDDGVDIAGPGTTGATGKGSNVKAFHGSLRDVVSPLQSLMKDAFATEMAIARNEVKKALIKLAESAGLGGASIAERIPANQASAITASIEQVTEHLTKSIDWRALSPRDAQSLAQAIDMIDDLSLPEMRIYKQGIINEKGKPIVFFFENGKRQAMQLADGEFGRDLYNALTNMNRNQLNVFLQALSVPSAMVRTGVTLDVGYAIGNYLRDQFAAWVLSPNGFIPFVSGAAGLVQHLANTKVAQKARSSGVIMGGSSTAALDDTRVNQDVRAIRETGVNFRRYKHWRALTLLSELSETGTRVGLFARNYNAGIKRGLSEYEAFKYAAYETNDFLNFGRHGSRTLAFRKTFSFAGVSIQGLDKALRTQGGWKYLPAALLPYVKYTKGMDLNEEDMRELGYSAKVMARMMILAVIAVSLRAMIGKDDEYDKMSPRIKATQFLGKIRGNWVSFPKPFELATPANIAELIYEAVYEKDPITFKKMSDRLWPLIEPPHYFNAVGPIAEHWANKRFYDESPILRDKLLGLEPYLQFNRYTSELSKMLGKATNTSPALIDHYVLSYTGTMGRYALQASNLTNPTRPDVGLADAPIARRFFRDPSRGNEATKEFWKLIQQKEGVFSSAYNTFEDLALHGAPGEARKYLDSLKIDQQTYVITKHLHSFSPNDHLDRRHPILRGERALGIISALRDQIATSSTFTPHEKRVIDEQLGKIAMAEARNALISIDRPGFQNRTTLAIANKMTGLQEVSPSAYEMLTTKYNEQKGAVNHKDNAVFTDEDVYAGYPALVQQMQDAKDDIAPPGDEANLPKRKYKNKALPLAVPLTAR